MKYLGLYPEILLALFTIKCIAIGNISIGDALAFIALIGFVGYRAFLNRTKTSELDEMKKSIASLQTAVRNFSTERPPKSPVTRPGSWSGLKQS